MMKEGTIFIISGEGERGTSEVYKGKGTTRALRMRIKKEECGGDRFCKVKRYEHTNDYGDQYTVFNPETGEWDIE